MSLPTLNPTPRPVPFRVLILWNGPDDGAIVDESTATDQPEEERFEPARTPHVLSREHQSRIVLDSLAASGFDVHRIDIEDDVSRLDDAVTVLQPGLIFNMIDQFSGDTTQHAAVTAYLELLQVPYTGSDPLCLATCQDRVRTHVLLRDAGIRVPGFGVIRDVNAIPDTADLRFPIIVTQAFDDIYDEEGWEHPLSDHDQLVTRSAQLFREFDLPYLVEEYIADKRMHVIVVGDRVLEVLPLIEASLDLDDPWRLAQLPHDAVDEVRDMACRTFRVMGCRDVAQIDVHLDASGVPHVVDIRPVLEFGPGSPMWAAAGFTERGPDGVLAELLTIARERTIAAPDAEFRPDGPDAGPPHAEDTADAGPGTAAAGTAQKTPPYDGVARL